MWWSGWAGRRGVRRLTAAGGPRCAGADKKVATWKTDDWRLAGQSKPVPKGAAHTVAFSPHGAAAFGDEPCLLLVRPPACPKPQAMPSAVAASPAPPAPSGGHCPRQIQSVVQCISAKPYPRPELEPYAWRTGGWRAGSGSGVAPWQRRGVYPGSAGDRYPGGHQEDAQAVHGRLPPADAAHRGCGRQLR